MTLTFDCTNQSLVRTDNNILAANSQKYVEAVFKFSEDWYNEKLIIPTTAVFEKDGKSYGVLVDESDNGCYIPHEVLSEGWFTVSLKGNKGETILTTETVSIEVVQGPAKYYDNAGEPTSTIVEQLYKYIRDAVEKVNNLEERAESGEFGGAVSEEDIKKAVEDYLTANPPTGGSGVSPTVEVKATTNGHMVIITDINGTHEFNVTNGKDGTSVTITEIEPSTESGGVNKVHFSNDEILGIRNGKDGKTPVVGKDYFTPEEKETFKSEIESKLINNSGFITKKDLPTIPDWAMQANKPTYSASEVGADAIGTATNKVTEHNTNTEAHNDLRLLITELTNRLNTLADSDDTTLDQISEIVAYIKANKALIESVTTSKVNVDDIINNLTTNVSNKPLSAAQGVELKRLIDAITVPTKTSQLTNDSGYITSIPIVQAKGDSVTDIMSQKAVTEAVNAPFAVRENKTPDYTNQIPLSTDENGNIFGYVAQSTIRGDGSVVTGSEHIGYVTGYIPVKEGDVIRIKDPSKPNFTTSVMFALYKYKGYVPPEGQDVGKVVSTMLSNVNFGEMSIDGNVLTWKLTNLNVYYWRDFTFARIMTLSADSIVTVNEELTESVKEELILKPSVKVTKDSLDVELGDKPLYGKVIVGFGDSIFGNTRGRTSVLSHVANVTGATVHNVGFGGCRMSTHPTNGYAAFSMWKLADAIASGDWSTQESEASSGSSYFTEQVALLKTIDFNNVDIVIIHYGSNDYTGYNVKIDDADNPYNCNTFIGAFRYSVEKLLTAFPHLQIYVSLPTYCKYSSGEPYPEEHTNSLGKYVYEYVEALRNAATEYNLSVIDGFYGLGVNKLTVDTLTSDGAHHNVTGRKRLGEFIGGYLIGNQSSGKSGIDADAVNALINTAIGNAIGGSY